jgi:hypothetical protein
MKDKKFWRRFQEREVLNTIGENVVGFFVCFAALGLEQECK